MRSPPPPMRGWLLRPPLHMLLARRAELGCLGCSSTGTPTAFSLPGEYLAEVGTAQFECLIYWPPVSLYFKRCFGSSCQGPEVSVLLDGSWVSWFNGIILVTAVANGSCQMAATYIIAGFATAPYTCRA